jgi:hypothetical protein
MANSAIIINKHRCLRRSIYLILFYQCISNTTGCPLPRLYYIISRRVILKDIDVTLQVPNIFDLNVSFRILNYNFVLFFLFVPEISASFTSYIV